MFALHLQILQTARWQLPHHGEVQSVTSLGPLGCELLFEDTVRIGRIHLIKDRYL